MILKLDDLNQRITVSFRTEQRAVTVVILDAADYSAADSAAAYAAQQFTWEELFGSLARGATIGVHENDQLQTFTEVTWQGGDVITDLEGLGDPISVVFEDLPPATPATA